MENRQPFPAPGPMAPPAGARSCQPKHSLPAAPEDLRGDDWQLAQSLAHVCFGAAKAHWFLKSLRLPGSGVPFQGTKWETTRLAALTIGEWCRALREGTITEVPTLTADLLVPALASPDTEVRAWAFIAIGMAPALPDARQAQALVDPATRGPLLPNTRDREVQALPAGRRRPWVRCDQDRRAVEDAWPGDE